MPVSPALIFPRLFGLWLLIMFVMALLGWQPAESKLSEAGVRWAHTPLAVNMAMYHAFVNQILVPGGVIATLICVCVAVMLWLNPKSYARLFQARPGD